MLTAERIPAFDEKTATGILRWWNSLLDLGVFIHSEDDQINTVNQKTEERLLDNATCQKISSTHDEMIRVISYEETYDADVTTFMNSNGWICGVTNDGWVEAETHKIDKSWCHKIANFLHYSPNHSPSSLT
jgi:hypothetical protein